MPERGKKSHGRPAARSSHAPTAFHGLAFVTGDADVLASLLENPRLARLGIFPLDEVTLAFPAASLAKVERELKSLQLIPRKV
ncbi:MAG: hypothetical protein GXP48_00575 [Acidobacteria bacterium]|nr:hypothetical protein [Acidobacteriota bacterium]